MAKLILSMDGVVIREVPLTKERTTIGRKPHNDIQIDNLAVSGERTPIEDIETMIKLPGTVWDVAPHGTLVMAQFLKRT